MTALTALPGPQWTLGSWQGNWTDANDVEWWVSTEEGWTASPDIRSTLEALPGDDGGSDASPLYSPRVITLTGAAIAPDATTMANARLGFSSTLEAQRGGTLSCTDLTGLTLSAFVRLSGPIRIAQNGINAFDFQLQLTAPDPRKYATPVETSVGLPASVGGLSFPVAFPADFGLSSGGSVTVTNAGTVRTWPVLRLAGPLVNPRVINPATGDELHVTATIPAGQYIDIDTSARTVLLNGTASRRAAVTVAGEWLPVAPGVSSFRFGSDVYDPSALLTVAVRSAWL